MGIRIRYEDVPGQRTARKVLVQPSNTDKWLEVGTVTERHGLWTAQLRPRLILSKPVAPWFGTREEAASWLLIVGKLARSPSNNGELTPVLPGFGESETAPVFPLGHPLFKAAA